MTASGSETLASDQLRGVQADVQATLKSIDSRIERVIIWAHEDEGRAQNEIQRLLRLHPDASPILEILRDDSKRHQHFGVLKKGIGTSKTKVELPGPLAEIPEAFRDRRHALARSADVAKAYRLALENEEREFFEKRSRARPQDREEPTQGQRRKRR